MRRITLLLSMIAVCCYAQIDKSKYQRQEHIKYNGKVYYSVHLNLADSMVTIPAEPENVVIRNPYYLGTGYFEWLWFSESVTGNHSTWEFVEKTFPKKEHYNIDKQHPEYKIFSGYSNSVGWFACKQDGALACAWTSLKEDDIIKAAMIYDFENNAYDINQEPKVIQTLVHNMLFEKMGSEEELGALIGKELYLNQEQNRARGLLALGLISQLEYNKIINNLNSQDKNLAKKAETIAKSSPTYEEKRRARDYVEQLEKDNKGITHVEGFGRAITVEQIDGTHFILHSPCSNFKAQMTVYLDKDGKDRQLIRVITK